MRKEIRPIPESLLIEFGEKLSKTDFSLVYNQTTSTKMVSKYQDILDAMISETFPLKTITISSDDKPWFNEELRTLKRRRLREYSRHGKSEKYLELQDMFDTKFQSEFQKYRLKIEAEVSQGKRGSSYFVVKKLGLRPGEVPQPSFQLPDHVENNYTTTESAEALAEYFSSVSQEYSPISVSNLPPNIQGYLQATLSPAEIIPSLSVYDVFRKICSAKKPNSAVPGDLPKKIIQNYANLLAEPSCAIFNTITYTSIYPDQWKIEHQIPIPKCFPPLSEDDIRNISKTQFLSKVYEAFVAGWLLPIITPYLDPGQCGGLKGLSVTHYLIKFLEFVHSNWDKRQPNAVLAACVDLSKAFNRVDHSMVIQDLYDMHTPAWLLKVIISYLSNRSMILTYNGELSKRKLLPGGGPQGAHLGGLIFIVKYNGAFLRPPIPRNVFGPIQTSKAKAVKFVDDGSVAVSINLKTCLSDDPRIRPLPLNYHERTCSVLPPENNLLQYYLDDVEKFAFENKMRINPKKTKIISFNKSRKYDYPPELKLSDGELLDVVTDVRLVGVIVDQTLSWQKNTDYICHKATQKLWVIRRLKKYNLTISALLDVYIKEIRSLLEHAVPVWHSGLTRKQSAQIEKVQKNAFKIILEKSYIDYETACTLLSVEPLEFRREELCIKFAKKDIKKVNTLFRKVEVVTKTRAQPKLVHEYSCRTRRYQNSSMPFLSRLLNKHG